MDALPQIEYWRELPGLVKGRVANVACMGFCARNPLPSEAQARVPTVCPWGNALAARETGRARPKAPAEMEAGVNALATFAQVKDGCVFSHAQCKRAYVAIRDRNKDPARRARQAGHGRTRRAAAAALAA